MAGLYFPEEEGLCEKINDVYDFLGMGTHIKYDGEIRLLYKPTNEKEKP